MFGHKDFVASAISFFFNKYSIGKIAGATEGLTFRFVHFQHIKNFPLTDENRYGTCFRWTFSNGMVVPMIFCVNVIGPLSSVASRRTLYIKEVILSKENKCGAIDVSVEA